MAPSWSRGGAICGRPDKAAGNVYTQKELCTQNILITFQMPGHLPQIPLRVSHDENQPAETEVTVAFFGKRYKKNACCSNTDMLKITRKPDDNKWI